MCFLGLMQLKMRLRMKGQKRIMSMNWNGRSLKLGI
ncbi:hypothetical protein LINPERHAP1_LOCUS14021 [Linum perenne]